MAMNETVGGPTWKWIAAILISMVGALITATMFSLTNRLTTLEGTASTNRSSIMQMQGQFEYIKTDLSEIKSLLNRHTEKSEVAK